MMACTRAAGGGGQSGEILPLLCRVDHGEEPQVVRGLGLSMWRMEEGWWISWERPWKGRFQGESEELGFARPSAAGAWGLWL